VGSARAYAIRSTGVSPTPVTTKVVLVSAWWMNGEPCVDVGLSSGTAPTVATIFSDVASTSTRAAEMSSLPSP
jgi:hypothetical protein